MCILFLLKLCAPPPFGTGIWFFNLSKMASLALLIQRIKSSIVKTVNTASLTQYLKQGYLVFYRYKDISDSILKKMDKNIPICHLSCSSQAVLLCISVKAWTLTPFIEGERRGSEQSLHWEPRSNIFWLQKFGLFVYCCKTSHIIRVKKVQ